MESINAIIWKQGCRPISSATPPVLYAHNPLVRLRHRAGAVRPADSILDTLLIVVIRDHAEGLTCPVVLVINSPAVPPESFTRGIEHDSDDFHSPRVTPLSCFFSCACVAFLFEATH